jgi:hypothetical protein
MKNSVWKVIIQVVISVLSSLLTILGGGAAGLFHVMWMF